MNIDFNELDISVLPAFKGGKKEYRAGIYSDGLNKIMDGMLVPGASIGMHTHEDSSEIVFVKRGRGKVIIDGDELPLSEGICHYCPKGHTHSIINDSEENLEFWAVVPQQ